MQNRSLKPEDYGFPKKFDVFDPRGEIDYKGKIVKAPVYPRYEFTTMIYPFENEDEERKFYHSKDMGYRKDEYKKRLTAIEASIKRGDEEEFKTLVMTTYSYTSAYIAICYRKYSSPFEYTYDGTWSKSEVVCSLPYVNNASTVTDTVDIKAEGLKWLFTAVELKCYGIVKHLLAEIDISKKDYEIIKPYILGLPKVLKDEIGTICERRANDGFGCLFGDEQAKEWLERAIELNNKAAIYYLARKYFETQSISNPKSHIKKTIELYERAIALNSREAMYDRATLYLRENYGKDIYQAALLYRSAYQSIEEEKKPFKYANKKITAFQNILAETQDLHSRYHAYMGLDESNNLAPEIISMCIEHPAEIVRYLIEDTFLAEDRKKIYLNALLQYIETHPEMDFKQQKYVVDPFYLDELSYTGWQAEVVKAIAEKFTLETPSQLADERAILLEFLLPLKRYVLLATCNKLFDKEKKIQLTPLQKILVLISEETRIEKLRNTLEEVKKYAKGDEALTCSINKVTLRIEELTSRNEPRNEPKKFTTPITPSKVHKSATDFKSEL